MGWVRNLLVISANIRIVRLLVWKVFSCRWRHREVEWWCKVMQGIWQPTTGTNFRTVMTEIYWNVIASSVKITWLCCWLLRIYEGKPSIDIDRLRQVTWCWNRSESASGHDDVWWWLVSHGSFLCLWVFSALFWLLFPLHLFNFGWLWQWQRTRSNVGQSDFELGSPHSESNFLAVWFFWTRPRPEGWPDQPFQVLLLCSALHVCLVVSIHAQHNFDEELALYELLDSDPVTLMHDAAGDDDGQPTAQTLVG